ncbi:MAG: HD-GYP domain-containing protein [Methylobacter sp.]|uniref:HD-GYP domain-containing protein n=1 Tax=Methylobacter sp. TaxID=2051955 RepID=UPI002730B0CA|nr:HD-GYP domain-containing protein [Methylobacter sp.]MDP1666338.1 HD-GYP domain-containing protein [Methylobacter sp.]
MSELLYILSTTGVTLAFLGFFIILELLLPFGFSETSKKQIRNVAFVLFGIATLKFHMNVGDDVIIDLRGTAIAIANIFGGYSVGFVTAVVEAIYRWSIGGPSAFADLIGIAGDFLISGILVHFSQTKSAPNEVRLRTILLAGIAVGVSEATCLLLIIPFSHGLLAFEKVGMTLFLAHLISTALFGGLLKLQDERSQALAESDQKNQVLNEVLKQSIGALSSAMVHRDPTTAGHEKRVADLAVAVGKELGFESDRLEGLYLATLVHDVGQIQIPTEILTRPRKLSVEEFELVKTHCESGYDILRDVKFPWPIAEIVYQHHENVDGSGYPRGLKDEQILPEAKIIHVCDSLEAMLSHRPFRRAYDIGYAIQQMQAYSSSHYDPEVVNACVRLFRDKGYTFPHPGK